ncbi:MAG: translation elongation factor Ts [Actinomycetota bacterium]|nr:translation elongation factor Ts [Actinomycetota bacterium]
MAEEKITAKHVKELREKTGAPIMDCKRVLVETGGDFDEAVILLRKEGILKSVEREQRAANQGLVEAYVHVGGQIGSIVEVNCETDFVARNEQFRDLAHQVALQVVACNPLYLDPESVPTEVLEREKGVYRSQCEAEGKPKEIWDNIIEGKLKKYYQEVCLLEQPYIRDPSISIGELITQAAVSFGEKIRVRRFCRFQVGENEKVESDGEQSV